MQSIGNAIAGFFIAVALVILIVVGFNVFTRQLDLATERLELDQTIAEREAYDACWGAATLDAHPTQDNRTMETVDFELYQLCLQDKDLSSNLSSDW